MNEGVNIGGSVISYRSCRNGNGIAAQLILIICRHRGEIYRNEIIGLAIIHPERGLTSPAVSLGLLNDLPEGSASDISGRHELRSQ